MLLDRDHERPQTLPLAARGAEDARRFRHSGTILDDNRVVRALIAKRAAGWTYGPFAIVHSANARLPRAAHRLYAEAHAATICVLFSSAPVPWDCVIRD